MLGSRVIAALCVVKLVHTMLLLYLAVSPALEPLAVGTRDFELFSNSRVYHLPPRHQHPRCFHFNLCTRSDGVCDVITVCEYKLQVVFFFAAPKTKRMKMRESYEENISRLCKCSLEIVNIRKFITFFVLQTRSFG